jgi:transcription initiation factor IIF auxiliary subunit
VNSMGIHFNNYARRIGSRGSYDWYEWKVFVDEKPEILDKIKQVQYLLHRTFPNPTRVSEDRKSKFALESSGWGSFTIYITVRYNDGTEEQAEYFLDLNKGWPK